MRIAAVLSPVAEWSPVVEAALAADEVGLDGIGLWGHYHSPKPEWGYVAGWSAFGALAAITRHVRLVPMVLNNLHYEPGVLAKESSTMAIASGGRFELGIGAGDWPESFRAWGRPFPLPDERVRRLEDAVEAVRRAWTGQPVTIARETVTLDGATCTPAPAEPPRVVVGVGSSRSTLARAVDFADEVNVYDDAEIIAEARAIIASAGRPIGLSVFLSWEWDKWPADPEARLAALSDRGVERAFVSLGADDMPDRIRRLAAAARWE